jgi:2'-5' RNA ligase
MRCFTGVDLSAYSRQFSDVATGLSYERLRQTQRHHITLEFWPALPEVEVYRLASALTHLNFKPFTLSLDRLIAIPDKKSPEVIALAPTRQEGFKTMQDAYWETTDRLMQEAPYHHIHTMLRTELLPHVTLLRAPHINGSETHKTLRKTRPLEIMIDNICIYGSDGEIGTEHYKEIARRRF